MAKKRNITTTVNKMLKGATVVLGNGLRYRMDPESHHLERYEKVPDQDYWEWRFCWCTLEQELYKIECKTCELNGLPPPEPIPAFNWTQHKRLMKKIQVSKLLLAYFQ